jgi:hypothetical protein
MKTLEEHLASYHQIVQASVPDEPVLSFGMMSLVGATQSAFTSVLSPLLGALQRRQGRQKAAGFPTSTIMALTATRLIAMEYRPAGRSLKIKRIVATFSRRDTGIELIAPSGRGLHHLRLRLPDGTAPEFELLRGIGPYQDLNGPFIASLQHPTS